VSQPVGLGSLRAVLRCVPLLLLLLLLLLRPGCAGNEAARPFCGAEAKLPPAAATSRTSDKGATQQLAKGQLLRYARGNGKEL
jgi:hypothetical protein